MMAPSHISALRDIVGVAGLLEDAADRRTYETASRYGSGVAACVVRPASTQEVSAVVGYCISHDIRFVPQSGNTGLTGGSTPDGSGSQVVLSLDRLTGPLDVHEADRLVVVGAGVRLSALNQVLEAHGLFVPIDLGADPMIGGMVATNTGGARFLRYGDMRRQVIGLEVVLADRRGTVLDLTTHLRKDNARLDLKHLFIGSCGAFGIVTKAVLDLHPRPVFSSAVLITPTDDSASLGILRAVERRLSGYLSAFEAMSGAALAHAFAHIPRLSNPFPGGRIPPYALLVEVSTSDPGVGASFLDDRLVEAISEIAAEAGGGLDDALFGRSEAFWAIRHAIPEGLRAAGPVIGLDLSFARSEVLAFRTAVRRELAELFPEFEVCDFGHLADGGVHFNVVARPGPIDADRTEQLKRYVMGRAVRDFGGSISGEHGLGPVVQSFYDELYEEQLKIYAGLLERAFQIRPSEVVRFGSRASVPPPIP